MAAIIHLLCCISGAAGLHQLVQPCQGCGTAAAVAVMRRRAPAPVLVEQWSPVSAGLQVRRWLYRRLEPIDQGDFRWEFLVPWTNKTLNSVDKFIVCSAFIGLSFTLQTLLDPGASVGVHLSYIAQFFSYAMGDPIGFRTLAVLTSLLEIGGNLFETKEAGLIVNGANFDLENAAASINAEDVFPIFYDQLFIFINGYYILRWLLTQEALIGALEWNEDEEALYTNCFAPLGFRRAQFCRLLRVATFVRVSDVEADVLTVQGEPIFDLYVPLNGTVEVRVGGTVTTTLPPYQLVGEASLLENLQSPSGEVHPPARATVVAAPGSFYVRWPQSSFFELQREEDSDFAYAIQLMIARTLSEKLSAARLSQSVSEQRLKSRLAAAMGGASPMDLAAKRLREAEEGVGDARLRSPGAAAEVEALLEQNKAKEVQVRMLQRALAESKSARADLQGQVTLLVALGLVVLVGGVAIAALPSDWWAHTLPELAANEFLQLRLAN
uniref:Cyclic nucleotide-binding domain-containing protein n=1 Tax=Haptolina brevifila TaxID=156173 RepID=A0A7S2FQG0_9EUKA|mmetsp:Transcript_17722/g.35751  ORF Transcript_17722/g.35751 Transcript_17722/m.35751 type:complete len:496 (+) Transcript_17722:143-1630(+)